MKAIYFSSLLLCLIICTSKLNAQNQPVAKSLKKHVNLFKGDLNYQIPLVTVPGPNGEAFPIKLTYQSGIGVDQNASSVGLGWNINIGEISRQVNGFPDDWNGKSFVKERTYYYNPPGESAQAENEVIDDVKAYGPLYFKDFDYNYANNALMDVFASTRSVTNTNSLYEGPDYDNYYLSAPGLSGQLEPFLFDFANLYGRPKGDWTYGDHTNSNTYKKFTKELQFILLESALVDVDAPYYENYNYKYDLQNPSFYGNDNTWDCNCSQIFYRGLRSPADLNNSPSYDIEGADYNHSAADDRQRVSGGVYVEYFTNQEIQDHYDNVELIDGFLDFKNNSGRNTQSFYDPDGIGGFRVTNVNGMTYHYSLPIYRSNEKFRTIDYYTNNLPHNNYFEYIKEDKFAISWKLTAITGPDYIDNGNNFPDALDEGYWIAINYEKWNHNNKVIKHRSPHFGVNLDRFDDGLPTYYSRRTYNLQGSRITTEGDQWYVNSIKTSTHTLFFVRDIRKDQFGIGSTSHGKVPLLSLRNLILLKNDDVVDEQIFQTLGTFNSTDFTDVSNTTYDENIIKLSDYQSSASVIDPLTLKNIKFNYDYSLAQNVYNNVNNTVTTVNRDFSNPVGEVLYKNVSNVSNNGSPLQSGKLTLKNIIFYGYEKDRIHSETNPSYEFEYLSGAENPNYNHRFKDFFGYYKFPQNPSAFDQLGYLNQTTKTYVDAWSLKKVITPLGSELEIEYESDKYGGVFYRNGRKEFGIPYRPRRLASSSSCPLTYCFEEITNAFGGGTRVKKLSLTEPDLNQSYDLELEYEKGVIGKEPARYARDDADDLVNTPSDRFAPSSEVLYGKVNMNFTAYINQTGNTQKLGSEEVHFRNFPDHFGRSEIRALKNNFNPSFSEVIPYVIEVNEIIEVVHHMSNDPGRVSKRIFRDFEGTLLKQVNYFYDLTSYAQITPSGSPKYSSISEAFYKEYFYNNNLETKYRHKKVSIRDFRHSYLNKVEVLKGDELTTTFYSEYDKYTGIPKRVEKVSNTLGSEIIEKELAYDNGFTAMGPKSLNPANDNMFTFVSKATNSKHPSTDVIKDFSKNRRLRDLNQTTGEYEFSSSSGLPWKAMKLYSNNDDPVESNWKLMNNVTLFSKNGKVNESKSEQIYSATKYAPDLYNLPITTASNSNYLSFAHSSFEYIETGGANTFFDNELKSGNTQFEASGSIQAHTGKFVARVTAAQVWGSGVHLKRQTDVVQGEEFERGIIPNQSYEASIWVHNNSPGGSILVVDIDGDDINGNCDSYDFVAKNQGGHLVIGDWTLMRIRFTVPEGYTSTDPADDVSVYFYNNSGNPQSGESPATAYFDDFRLQPVNATVNATVYNDRLLPEYQINNENLYTRFEYDESGNISKVYVEKEGGEVLKKENINHYAQ